MTILTETDYYHRFVNIFNECGWKICFDHYNSNELTDIINIEFEKLEQCRKEFCKDLDEENMRIFCEYWCLNLDEELSKNFETYMQQVLSTIYENNWYINPNRFSNAIELFNYIIHIHNYGFTEENDESEEENEHSDEEEIREAPRERLEQYF